MTTRAALVIATALAIAPARARDLAKVTRPWFPGMPVAIRSAVADASAHNPASACN